MSSRSVHRPFADLASRVVVRPQAASPSAAHRRPDGPGPGPEIDATLSAARRRSEPNHSARKAGNPANSRAEQQQPQAAAPAHDPAEDDRYFREAMHGIHRQPTPQRHAPHTKPVSTHARQRELDDHAVLHESLHGGEHPELAETGETLLYRAQGVQDSVLRRLRRGNYTLENEIDLHGLNRHKAQMAVHQFLANCLDRDHRCVRIVHGKGNGSPNSGPVIKRLVDSWLRKRHEVLAFCTARPEDGGTGAIYVLLRSGWHHPR